MNKVRIEHHVEFNTMNIWVLSGQAKVEILRLLQESPIVKVVSDQGEYIHVSIYKLAKWFEVDRLKSDIYTIASYCEEAHAKKSLLVINESLTVDPYAINGIRVMPAKYNTLADKDGAKPYVIIDTPNHDTVRFDTDDEAIAFKEKLERRLMEYGICVTHL